MDQRQSTMIYAVLQGQHCEAQGFARMDTATETLCVSLAMPVGQPEGFLRILLLSSGNEGAVQHLGKTEFSASGRVWWTKQLPGIDLTLWDAVGLAEDWPSGKLVAAAWLGTPGQMWQLAEAASHFLAVPLE